MDAVARHRCVKIIGGPCCARCQPKNQPQPQRWREAAPAFKAKVCALYAVHRSFPSILCRRTIADRLEVGLLEKRQVCDACETECAQCRSLQLKVDRCDVKSVGFFTPGISYIRKPGSLATVGDVEKC